LPSFGNYGFGTAATVKVNRFIGVEGELGAMIATDSSLQFGDLPSNIKAPNVLNYAASAVVTPWTGHSFAPYGVAGVGGLTMFERPELGITKDETFLTGNFGGGLKWYAPNNRWGLRGDYRFQVIRSKDDAPEFFGRDTRYVHRVYAGVTINTGR
jgi:opacity protein-like surface antigen